MPVLAAAWRGHTGGVGGELLVGRRDELAVLLDTVGGEGPPYAVLTAGPGMGKTSVLAALLARAGDRDVRILHAAPTELEESLGFCALADLLASCDEDVHDQLPAPQRTALRAALLLEESPGDIDPRAVAVAFRTVLGSLAQQQPLALVIDDAHWLDGATTQALGHALRRSTDLPIRVVAATRPFGRNVDDWLPTRPEARVDLVLGAMRPGELGAVVRQATGTAVERSALPGLAAASEGNPLFAIEVGEAARPSSPREDLRRLAVPAPRRPAARDALHPADGGARGDADARRRRRCPVHDSRRRGGHPRTRGPGRTGVGARPDPVRPPALRERSDGGVERGRGLRGARGPRRGRCR